MQLRPSTSTLYQASARGGWIDCELAADRVFLGGNAVTFMEANISLPSDFIK